MSEKSLLITGARGRIASALIPMLRDSGYEIFKASRHDGEDYLSYDILDQPTMPNKVSIVLHLAWSTVPRDSSLGQGIEWQEDLPLLIRLLSSFRKLRDKQLKPVQIIFFSSSGAILENSKAGASGGLLPEPAGWYGLAKLHAEQLLQKAALEDGFIPTILRLSNLYGFHDLANKPQGLIPHLVASGLNKNPFVRWGNGSNRKDYLHIRDLFSAVVAAITKRVSGVYNIASGSSYSLNEIVKEVEHALSTSICIQEQPPFSWDKDVPMIDNSKFKKDTGWAPQINVRDGIREFIKKYQK
jgi:UDP-glucose 4-epimerase